MIASQPGRQTTDKQQRLEELEQEQEQDNDDDKKRECSADNLVIS